MPSRRADPPGRPPAPRRGADSAAEAAGEGGAGSQSGTAVSLDGLLCALVLAPSAWSRNRLFGLFEAPAARLTRRRAARVRSMLRQLARRGPTAAEVVGEQVLASGDVVLRYAIPPLGYQRTAALSALEAAVLRYALARSREEAPAAADQRLVEEALARLGPHAGITPAPAPITGPDAP